VGAQSPLSFWNDTEAKRSIIDFVERITQPDTSDFVPEPDRVAVFDNDGTLWPEAPLPFQVAYVIDELKRRTPDEPHLAADPMVQAALGGDVAALMAGAHHDGLMRVLALTHAGMTTDEFDNTVEAWLSSAKHPRFGRGYDQLTYRPQQQLLAYVHAHGFKNFIVSGGGADFMRVWAERVYSIPPEQVVGSTARVEYEFREGIPKLTKTTDYVFVNDSGGKPAGIHQHIGRRPVMCVGNSDGDQAMLEYTTMGNPRPSLGVLIHHTDDQREYQYDEKPPATGKLVSALQAAKPNGWIVVDMKLDWNKVFAD
jgi:phosphoglycolate phosphatase-like HAD superfamily hydrolase